MGTRVDLLGPVRLRIDGVDIGISRTQVRRALALLAANSGRTVTQDRLVEHLWGSQLPADPRASLRVALSRLREVLQPHEAVLQPAAGGYLIEVHTDVLDFESAVAAASQAEDLAQQAALLNAALSLWRSPRPVEDLDEAPLLEPFVNRLIQSRVVAKRRYVSVLASLDSHEEAIAVGADLLNEYPGDEQVALLCATSMAAVGRKAAAIQLLGDTRDYLRDNLGLSPSPEVLALEDRILREGVQIAAVVTNPSARRGPRTFVGRDAELLILGQANVGLDVVVGEPGGGKTALLNKAVGLLEAAGRTVLRSTASATPVRPMEVLSALLVGIARAAQPVDQTPGLLSALASLAPELVGDDVVPPGSRDSLLGLAREAIEWFATRERAIVVIDDAQWLDRSSAQVLDELADTRRISLLVSTRQSLPAHLQFLHDTSADHIRVLSLRPLTRSDVESFVALELPLLPQQATVSRLLDQSGGNPLFLSLLADLMAEGTFTADSLPPNILVGVQRRIDSMSSRAQKTLQLASVFSGGFSVDLLCKLQPTARADIDEAVAESLVEPAEDTPDVAAFRFTHALIAEAAYQLLPEGTRLELHDEVGRVLEQAGSPAAAFAMHCGEAASLDPLRAVHSHLAAAEEFAESFAWDIATAHAERALGYEQQFGVENMAVRAELLVLVGRSLRAQGRPAGDDPLHAGVKLATLHNMIDVAVTGLVALSTHGRMGTDLGQQIYPILEATLGTTDLTPSQRARLLAAGSTLLAVSPLQERGRAMFREASESLAELDDPEVVREVLLRTHLGCPHLDDFDRRLRSTDLLAGVAHDDPDIMWEVAYLRFGSAMVQGDAAAASLSLQRMRALTPRTRLRRREFGMRFSEAAWSRFEGDLAAAEAHLDEAMTIGAESFEDEWTFVTWAAVMSSIREAQGRLHELLPFVDGWIDADPGWPTWHVVAAACAASSGDTARARAELDWLMRDRFECLSPDTSWSAMFSFLTAPVVLLQDERAAATLLATLRPYAGLNLWNGVCIHQSVDRVCEIYRDVAGATVNQTESPNV